MTLPLENTLVASKDKNGKSTPAKNTGEKKQEQIDKVIKYMKKVIGIKDKI